MGVVVTIDCTKVAGIVMLAEVSIKIVTNQATLLEVSNSVRLGYLGVIITVVDISITVIQVELLAMVELNEELIVGTVDVFIIAFSPFYLNGSISIISINSVLHSNTASFD